MRKMEKKNQTRIQNNFQNKGQLIVMKKREMNDWTKILQIEIFFLSDI
jgi:hypothetical protein